MSQMKFTKNPSGVRVKECCASCAHKEITRALSLRHCTKHHRLVKSCDRCEDWQMSGMLRKMNNQ